MATSSVGIANLALSLLGEEAITSLTENTARARIMNVWYEQIRDTVAASHLWNELKSRAQLSKDLTGPIFGFSHSYQLPSDFLRLHRFNDGKQLFKIEGKKLLSDADGARIIYVRKETDPNMFTPLLVMAIASRLAHETCVQITGDQTLKNALWELYLMKLQEARGVDAQQGPLEVMEADEWIDARISHGDELFRPIEDLGA